MMRTRACVWLKLGLPLLSCIFAGACAQRLHDASSFASIYGRAEARFTNAFLLKPAESGTSDSPSFRLSPLIIQEVMDTNDTVTLPEILFHQSTTELNGEIFQQVTYLWRRSQSGRMQGVRITLDASGSPVIWQVLSDTSGARIVFVAQSLETAALREFGSPLPGRRFAVERGLEEAPEVVVARVIEDGPVPMGPILYLKAGTQDVSTIICRCMDAQAQQLVGTGYYELRVMSEGQPESPLRRRTEEGLRLPRAKNLFPTAARTE
jgi:hypothetical protein